MTGRNLFRQNKRKEEAKVHYIERASLKEMCVKRCTSPKNNSNGTTINRASNIEMRITATLSFPLG